MPCSPSSPPVIEEALFAASCNSVATTRVCISSVRPVVRSTTSPETNPTSAAASAAGKQAADRLAPAVRRENAGGIGAGAEERGMAQRDDAGIAQHQIGRQREQDRRQDLRAQRQIARESTIGRDRRGPGQRFERLEAMAPGEGVDRSHSAGLSARPNKPLGRHSRIAIVRA